MIPAVVTEALSWVGTPYHPHGRVKGVGVDCAMLLAEVYERAGVVERVDPGAYPQQFGMHREEEQFAGWLARYADPVDDPAPGRAVLFKFGRCFSHGGIMINDTELVHAVLKVGSVIVGALSDPDVSRRARQFFEVRHGR